MRDRLSDLEAADRINTLKDELYNTQHLASADRACGYTPTERQNRFANHPAILAALEAVARSNSATVIE